MLHDRGPEVTVYDNSQLRNTWEARTKQYKAKTLGENERRQKSALPQLFNQWQTRLTFRTGASAEKKARGSDISDFRRVLEVESRSEEDQKPKRLVIQPRPKPTPQPIISKPLVPPICLPKICPSEPRKPSRTQRPPPKPEVAPKREEVKLRKVLKPEAVRQKEPVKIEREKVVLSSIAEKPSNVQPPQQPKKNVQKGPDIKGKPSSVNWSQSWKYVKPQPHKKKGLRSKKESLSNRYRSSKWMDSLQYIETPSLAEWIESWKFLKDQCNLSKEKKFMPEKLKRKESLLYEVQQENICITEWADSWKILNLQLHQENESWEKGWSKYSRDFQSNKLQNSQLNSEKSSLLGWEESWKLLKSQPEQMREPMPENRHSESRVLQHDNMKKMQKNWIDSWKFTNPQGHDDKLPLTEWNESWRSCSVPGRNKESMDFHHSYIMCMLRNMKANSVFNSQLPEEKPSLSEWTESWKLPKSQDNQCERKSELQEDVSNQPLPLESQMENTYLSQWNKSWKFTNPPNQSVWSNSWKLSNSKKNEMDVVLSQGDTNTSTHLILFEPKNVTFSMSEWDASKEKLALSEWNDSWKTIKPQPHQNTEPESKTKESSYLSDCNGSLSTSQVHSHTSSLSEWTDSWRLSNPQPHKEKESRPKKRSFKESLNFHMENPSVSEWSDSWKIPKSGSLGPQENTENTPQSEWGVSWKIVNPQCCAQWVSWSQQEESANIQTENELTLLAKGDRSSKCFDQELQLCLSEWNESWKFLKPQSQEQREARSK